MRVCLLLALVGLAGCFTAEPVTSVDGVGGDTGAEGNGNGNAGGPDTGTAFVMWHGEVAYDPVFERFTGKRGYGAMTLSNSKFICDIEARYEGTGIGPTGCPECEWSFAVRVTEGGTSGPGCESFIGATAFDYAEYSDFYFGSAVNGFGWTEAYTYTYGNTEYYLTSVVWAHIQTGAYNGWYFYGYDIPSMGIQGVNGDKYSAEFQRYAVTNNSTKLYYYFYY